MRIIILLYCLVSCAPNNEITHAKEYIFFGQQSYFLAETGNKRYSKTYRLAENIGGSLLNNCHKSIQINYIYPGGKDPFSLDPIIRAEQMVKEARKIQLGQKSKNEIEPTAMKSPDGKAAITYMSIWLPTGRIELDHVTAVSKYNTINLDNTSVLRSVEFDVRSRGISESCNREINENLDKWIKLVANSEFTVISNN